MVQKFIQYLVMAVMFYMSVVGLEGASVGPGYGVPPAQVRASAKQARYTAAKQKAQRRKEALERKARRKKEAEREALDFQQAMAKAMYEFDDVSLPNTVTETQAASDLIPSTQQLPQVRATLIEEAEGDSPSRDQTDPIVLSENTRGNLEWQQQSQARRGTIHRLLRSGGLGNELTQSVNQTIQQIRSQREADRLRTNQMTGEFLEGFELPPAGSDVNQDEIVDAIPSSPPLLRRDGPEYNENIPPLALTSPAQNATHSTSFSSIRTDIAEGSVPPVSRLSVRQTPQNGRDPNEGLGIVDHEVDAVPQSSVGRNGATSSGATSRQKRRAAHLAAQQPGPVNIPTLPPSSLPGQVMSGASSLQRRSNNRSSHASHRERKYRVDGYVHDSSSSQDSFSSGSDNEGVRIEASQYEALPGQVSLRDGRIPERNRNDSTTTTTLDAIPKLQDFRHYDQKPVFKVFTNDQSSTKILILTSNERGELIVSEVESITKNVIEVSRRSLSNDKVTFVDLSSYALIVGYASGRLERWPRTDTHTFGSSPLSITPLLSPPSHAKQNPIFDYKEVGGKETLLTLSGFYVQEGVQRGYRRWEMFPVGVVQEEDADFIGFQAKDQPHGMALGSKYYRSIWKVGPMAYKIFGRSNTHSAFQQPTIFDYNYIDYFAAASDASTILMHSKADNTIILLRDDLSKQGAVLQNVPQRLRSEAARIKDSTVLALGVDPRGEFGLSVHPDGWLKIWDLRLPGKEMLARVEHLEREFRKKQVVAATLTARQDAGAERIVYYYVGFVDGTVACDVVVLGELPSDRCCTIM